MLDRFGGRARFVAGIDARLQVRSGMIQHADSAAILDGWLYFNTNQLQLSPSRQYNNTDNRKGPFRSYRVWIGRGPAV